MTTSCARDADVLWTNLQIVSITTAVLSAYVSMIRLGILTTGEPKTLTFVAAFVLH